MIATQPNPLRILIADDHRMFREGLRSLLEVEDDLTVVGEAANGAQAIDMVASLEPDVLLLDLAMPNLTGVETLRDMTTRPAATKIIMLTASISNDEVVKALQFGANGVVLKDEASETLLRAIRAVIGGEYWVGQQNVATLVEVWRRLHRTAEPAPKTDYGLTARELEIVAAVVAAFSNKDIAAKLRISEKTVKHHLTNVFDKLGVSNRLELALFALNHTLALPELVD